MVGKTKAIALGPTFLLIVLTSTPLLSQSKSTSSAASPVQSAVLAAGIEFPVRLEQKVVAGSTPVGTKVRAKLAVATFLKGVVVPEDAVFSGEVTESAAKTASDPSRLSIRMDSVEWKNKSGTNAAPGVITLTPKVYVTSWYYPPAPPIVKDRSPYDDIPHNPRFGGASGLPPGQRNVPFPGDPNADKPSAPSSELSNHRVEIKDVESTHDAENAIILSSKRSNIKLDRAITYVLGAGNLGKAP
jgi:hypothetical protein